MKTHSADLQSAGIQSVEVGFGLLEALAAARGPLMLRDVALAAGMSAAKAHRYLASFARLGLVVQDSASSRYDLGPFALRLGLAALSRLDAVKLARERLNRLALDIGHTLALAVWGNHGPTIVHWQEPSQAVTVSLRLGDVMPLLSSATGRCFAAYKPREAVAAMLTRELAQSKKTAPHADVPTTRKQVDALLDEVRRRGGARVVDTLLPGVVGFCVPVFDADGHLALGLVALGSAATMDAAWQGAVHKPLAVAAARLSADLGFSH
jgi:DNA-binding IclR family transcriptional regulator